VADIQKQLLDPAVIGTTGVLKSIKKNAPSVKRVIITSSFAAIINRTKGNWPEHTYSEKDFNPITQAEALENAGAGYGASKTFAEAAAWDFVEAEKPDFALTTMNPPMIYGPITNHSNSLESLNTSNQRARDAIQGKWKTEIPPTGVHLWVDVRDVALGHVLAIESDKVAGQRVLATSGYFSNREIVESVRKNFPEYIDQLPGADVKSGDYPEGGLYKIDNSRFKGLLDKDFISFEQCMIDLVKSLKQVGA
jgi:nucleoside-diphosphate-sugar epimerase